MNVKRIRFIDRVVGSLLIFIAGFFIREKTLAKPENILVVQLWGIGETILTLPALRALREKYPGKKISMLCTSRNKDVYFKNPDLDDVIELEPGFSDIVKTMVKRRRSYDLVIDMEEYLNISALISFALGKQRLGYDHGIRAKIFHQTVVYNDRQHASQTFMDLLKPLGIKKKVAKLLPLQSSETDKKRVKELLEGLKVSGKFAVFAPGSAESGKIRLWKNGKWSELINRIHLKLKMTVLLVGAPDVFELNQEIISKVRNKKKIHNVAGKTSVKGLFELVKLAEVMASIDSGPMHVGAAQGIPTVGLFSPNTPVRFGPLGRKCAAIYKPVTESPAINVHKGEIPESSEDYLRKISVGDVMEAIEKIIK